jgi:hypothetical protein
VSRISDIYSYQTLKRVDYAKECRHHDGSYLEMRSNSTQSEKYEIALTLFRRLLNLTGTVDPGEIDFEAETEEFRSLMIGGVFDYERGLLAREIFFGSDCLEHLNKVKDNKWLRCVISEAISAQSAINSILNADITKVDLSLYLKNISIACRLLSPSKAMFVYGLIGSVYNTAGVVAKLNGKEIPELYRMARYLFDFEVFPLSYCGEVETVAEHCQAFYEVLWNEFPKIVFAACKNVEEFAVYAKLVWSNVKARKDEREDWNETVSRIIKRSGWFCPGQENVKISEIAALLYDDVEYRDLSLFIYAFSLASKDQVRAEDAQRKVCEAFLDHTVQGIKTQVLLTQLLMGVCGDCTHWKEDLLICLRFIKENSYYRDKDVLLATYKGWKNPYYFVRHSTPRFEDYYSPDIATGLEEDPESWVSVLEDFFLSERPPKSLFAMRAFYPPLKRFLLSGNPDQKLNASINNVFGKVLTLLNSALSEDVELLIQNFSTDKEKVIVSVFTQIQEIHLSETSRLKLTTLLLSVNSLQSADIHVLIRLFETSTHPSKLALTALDTIQANRNLDYTYKARIIGLWKFYLLIAQTAQTEQVHERIFVSFARTLTGGYLNLRSAISNSHDMAHLLSLLNTIQLYANTPVNQELRRKLCNYLQRDLEKETEDKYKRTNLFYMTYIVLNLNPEYDSSKSELSNFEFKYFVRAAKWFYLHKHNPAQIDIEEFVSDFEDILNAEIEMNCMRYSEILIDLICEFHDEPYFDVVRDRLLVEIAARPKATEGFTPTLMLLVAKKHVQEGNDVPANIKEFLLDVEKWYKNKEDESQFNRRYVQRDVLQEIARLFSALTIDCLFVRF